MALVTVVNAVSTSEPPGVVAVLPFVFAGHLDEKDAVSRVRHLLCAQLAPEVPEEKRGEVGSRVDEIFTLHFMLTDLL